MKIFKSPLAGEYLKLLLGCLLSIQTPSAILTRNPPNCSGAATIAGDVRKVDPARSR